MRFNVGDSLHLYHATPLLRLPSILADRAVFAKSVLAGRGLLGRSTARRRDAMLELSDYVHFSVTPITPLLRDKAKLGYPHALLEFDGNEILDQPGTACLKYNTKSWLSKASFTPELDPDRIHGVIRDCLTHKRYPSVEILAKIAVPISKMTTIYVVGDAWQEVMSDLMTAFGYDSVEIKCINPNPSCCATEYNETLRQFLERCIDSRSVVEIPDLPFD